jgi:acyl-coenzyme A thioesterase PaaI-like protein
MRKVINPYRADPGSRCFGCSPKNPIGLALEFFEDDGEIVTTWNAGPDYTGFEGVLHGGIQATAHDEIASWVVFTKARTAGWTANLSVEYKAPVLIDKGPVTLRARLVRMDGNRAIVSSTLFDGSGAVGSEAKVEYFTVPEHIARKRFRYPGAEAFFEETR